MEASQAEFPGRLTGVRLVSVEASTVSQNDASPYVIPHEKNPVLAIAVHYYQKVVGRNCSWKNYCLENENSVMALKIA